MENSWLIAVLTALGIVSSNACTGIELKAEDGGVALFLSAYPMYGIKPFHYG